MVLRPCLIASPVECPGDGLVVAYLQRANQSALEFVRKAEISPELSGFCKMAFPVGRAGSHDRHCSDWLAGARHAWGEWARSNSPAWD